MRHSAAACPSSRATIASSHSPASLARAGCPRRRRRPRSRARSWPPRATRERRRLRERRRVPGHQLQHQIQRDVGDELEGDHVVARVGLQVAQQLHRRRQVGHGDQRGDHLARLREQLQRRGGDHAQRPLAADEQLLEVVAGVVLAQPAQHRQHLAGRQHDLQAQHQVARHPVAQHRGAAGVGRDVAADLAGPLGGQRQREQPARRVARPPAPAARCSRTSTVIRLSNASTEAHAVHARQRQHHRAPRLVGRGAAAQAGVAALRDHGDPARREQRQHPRDLVGGCRAAPCRPRGP